MDFEAKAKEITTIALEKIKDTVITIIKVHPNVQEIGVCLDRLSHLLAIIEPIVDTIADDFPQYHLALQMAQNFTAVPKKAEAA